MRQEAVGHEPRSLEPEMVRNPRIGYVPEDTPAHSLFRPEPEREGAFIVVLVPGPEPAVFGVKGLPPVIRPDSVEPPDPSLDATFCD